MRNLLKERNLTQQSVADALGVHQTLVSQWCTGRTKPSLEYAQKLAVLLGVSTDDIIAVVRTASQNK